MATARHFAKRPTKVRECPQKQQPKKIEYHSYRLVMGSNIVYDFKTSKIMDSRRKLINTLANSLTSCQIVFKSKRSTHTVVQGT